MPERAGGLHMDIKPLVFLLVFSAPTILWAEEALKDPYQRDDDISGTLVSVKTTQRTDGQYEYVYTVAGPADNKGIVASFLLDLHCDRVLDRTGLPASQENGLIRIENIPEFVAAPGFHTPVAISADYGSAGFMAITLEHWAQWVLELQQGETLTGLRLVSKEAPALRAYQLTPFMDTDGWDYSDEEDPNLPWIPDFTVTGMVAGPACPGVTTPIEEPSFAGAVNREPDPINQLLTYTAPLVDRWRVASGVRSFELKITYAAAIDPKTFRVEPAWAKNMFHPVPGSSETVVLPLKDARNIFKLEVSMAKRHTQRKDDAEHFSYMDKDVFEVRRDKPATGRR